MTLRSHDKAYFDALYAAHSDPWDFRSSPYEHQKYAATCATLSGRHYEAALEVGCSIGELSVRIAPICTSFLGVDIAEAPLVQARHRCAHIPGAQFRQAMLPRDWPSGTYDLIVLSEVLYFFSAAEIGMLARLTRTSLRRNSRIILVNWLGSTETPQPGDVAADCFIRLADLPIVHTTREPLYRLDVLANAHLPMSGF